MTTMTQTRARLEARPLHPALGAAVTGIDMRAPLDPETRRELLALWMKHLVLVFPGQRITDPEHVAFTWHFGEPEIFHQNIIKSRQVPEIFRVANVDEENRLMPAENPVVRQLLSTLMWHTDSSYRPVPAMGSLLHGIEISRTGGETHFTNMYAVWDGLPDRLRRAVTGRKARHSFDYFRELRGLPPASAEERAAMPAVWQPLVRRHPVTGRQSLYISPIYNDAIEGMPPEDAKPLIAELAEFAGRPEFVYRHRWEPDDVLLWDNRCTMHKITPYDPGERRILHRTTIVGDGPVLAA